MKREEDKRCYVAMRYKNPLSRLKCNKNSNQLLEDDSNFDFTTNVSWINNTPLHISNPNLIYKMTMPPAKSVQHHHGPDLAHIMFIYFFVYDLLLQSLCQFGQVVPVKMCTFVDPTAERIAISLGLHSCPCVAPISNGMIDLSGYEIKVCKSRRCPRLSGNGLIMIDEVVGASFHTP